MREILQLCGLISEKGGWFKKHMENDIIASIINHKVYILVNTLFQVSRTTRGEGRYFSGNCLTFTGV